MAFLGTASLEKLLASNKVVTPWKQTHVKNGAYELTLGNQVFQTDGKPRAIRELSDNEIIYISPGQFALLLTEETVSIPSDKIAFISIKAGIKFKGLVNVSGFHVDPGFSGRLLFSVYNAGPSTITLRRGERCFPLWFADLNEHQKYAGKHENQLHIPKEPVEALSQGDLASPNSLMELIKGLDSKIAILEKEQKASDYLVKTGTGLFIVIFLKIAFDFFAYMNGVEKGRILKQNEISADSTINALLKEKYRLQNDIDSMRSLRDSVKK